jgi:hypothetical protein
MPSRSTERGWKCPECKRQFGRRNQSHVCAPSGTVAGYFEHRPPVQRAIFDKLAAHLRRLGPVTIDPVLACVMFKRTRTFAEVRGKKRALTLYFILSRELDEPRIARRMRLSANRTCYVVDLATVRDVDAEVRAWLTEAYAASPV